MRRTTKPRSDIPTPHNDRRVPAAPSGAEDHYQLPLPLDAFADLPQLRHRRRRRVRAAVPGFCKSATLEEVRKHGHVLTPGRYVGAEPQADDGEPFAEKMVRLSAQWREQQAEADRLDEAIEANLRSLGFTMDAEENHASPD